MSEDDSIWDGVQVDWGGRSAPTIASQKNAESLLRILRPLNLMPKSAGRGFWETTILSWKDPLVDIEVFDGRFELYIYPPLVSGPLFDVHEFDGGLESDLDRLLEKLKTLLN
ncbi:MAG: hypothetical protein Gyms2KO_42950 [Gymnodinialimonas sp.]